MTAIILILVAVLLIVLGSGAAVWYFLRRRQQAEKASEETAARETLPFRWHYITAPIILLVLFVVLSAIFYPRLPTEVGYQFRPDGTPGSWLSRETAMVLMLAPQFFLALLAGLITWGMTRMSILSVQAESLGIKPQRVLSLAGNISALPQLVLGFTIFDIFSYNAYQIHIMPVWVAVLVLVLSAVVLGIAFFIFVYRARGRLFYQPEEKQ